MNDKRLSQEQENNATLAITHPELLEQWDYEKNTLDPEKITRGSRNKAWWKCRKVPHHIWSASIGERTGPHKTGCPICANQKICPVDACNSIGGIKNNDGSLKYGELLKELANPDDKNKYTSSSEKKVLWKCKKVSHHTWSASISNRTGTNKTGCPTCTNRKICPVDACNSIGKVNNKDGTLKYEELLKEWGGKEEDIYKYTPSTDKKVLWKCSKVPHHEWSSSINSRTGTHKCGCPFCRESKGEKAISETLTSLGVFFQAQKRQIMCVNNYTRKRRLCFDFYGTHNDINFAIEYDGEQHFDPDTYYSKKGNFHDSQLKDWLKTRWCSENNIKLFRIHYRDISKIPELITNYIENIENMGILELSSNPNEDYDIMIADEHPE